MIKACYRVYWLVAILGLFGVSCSPVRQSSEEKTSKEARFLLGSAADFSKETLASLDESLLENDWSYQRVSARALWADLNQSVPGQKNLNFLKWQTWYAREDLARIFHILYSGLSKEERASRQSFSAEGIERALAYHDEGQFLEATWNTASFDRWFAKFDSEDKKLSIAGINKVLMNKTALVFFLENYAAIDRCAKIKERGTDENCPSLTLPLHAAFLKTAWRRGQDDFLVPYYSTKDLPSQFAAEEWQTKGEGIPAAGASFRMQTTTGQIYHLTAVHLTLRLSSRWFWTSLWLESDSSVSSPFVWDHYKSCAASDFVPLAHRAEASPEQAQASLAEAELSASWCSNPYLEGGRANQKTNCIGCHQHAGSNWSEDVFIDHLTHDLPLMTRNADAHSKSDQVWSLYNGPEPFASLISQDIDYFDVYDIY